MVPVDLNTVNVTIYITGTVTMCLIGSPTYLGENSSCTSSPTIEYNGV